MKRHSIQFIFNNFSLKRWLLKVGSVRRKTLLIKLKEDLQRLGSTGSINSASSKAFLQLCSNAIVPLQQVATAQMTSRACMKHAKLHKSQNSHHFGSTHEGRRSHNNGNKKKSAISPNTDPNKLLSMDLLGSSGKIEVGHRNQRTSSVFEISYRGNDKSAKIQNSTTSEDKSDREVMDRERNTSSRIIRIKEKINSKKSKNKNRDSSKHSLDKANCFNEKLEDQHQGSKGEKALKPHRSATKMDTKRRCRSEVQKLITAENPNNVTWRLIDIDKDALPKPRAPGTRFRQIRVERKRKKDRLYAKFLEIFGGDSDLENYDTNTVPPASSLRTRDQVIPNDSCESSSSSLDSRCVPTIDFATSLSKAETVEARDRKSPIFTSTNVKKPKKRNTKINSIHSEIGGNSSSARSCSNSTTSTMFSNKTLGRKDNCMPQIVEKKNVMLLPVDDSIVILTASADQHDQDTSAESVLGLQNEGDGNLERCHSRSPSGDYMTTTTPREQSVIVEPFAKLRSDNPLVASATLRALSVTNCTNLAQMTENMTKLTTSSTTSGLTSDNRKFQSNSSGIPVLPHIRFAPSDVGFNDDKIYLEIPRSSTWRPPPNCNENPNPSSTTDTESSNIPKLDMSCSSDRLLGALDNICLFLFCRRRLKERQKLANKLAIKHNRQEEILEAQHEFESKLTVYRDELLYLFKHLGTWDQVLCYIFQGLENRTPADTERFSEAEVHVAMQEASLNVPSCRVKEESSEAKNIRSDRNVICTIDLTGDNLEEGVKIEVCDSSTDPLQNRNYIEATKDGQNNNCASSVNVDNFKHDFNANEISMQLPSIVEVTSISWQQYEKFEDKPSLPSQVEYPCYFCSQSSHVACSRCAQAIYCSKKCQELDWKQSHHAKCIPYRKKVPVGKMETE